MPQITQEATNVECEHRHTGSSLSKARRLFNIAVDEEWLLRSPFTKAVSKNLIHDAAETPDPIKTRELTDEEALRVMKALDTPERRHTLPVFIAAMDTGARKSSLLDYLRWKDINFGDEIITLTAYKGKGRNIKPKRWSVQMTSRLKKELLQLQLQRKNKNDDALVFEDAKVNLRKLWTAAYAEAGVPKGTRLFYSVRHNFGTEMANEGMHYDLIYGLPFRMQRRVEQTIEAVLRLRPDRIAFYGYAHVPWVKPGQRHFTERDLPAGDEKRGLYEFGRLLLESAGYREIGMDHFALESESFWRASINGTFHRNFMGYAPRLVAPLIGLGVSAISDAWDAFAQNEKTIEVYEERVANGEIPIFAATDSATRTSF